jgi:glycosyltransferase involved in cell wall biosynthesis
VFDNANAPALMLYKIFKKRYSINTDGLGWQRDKWGYFAKKYYKWSEWACVKLCKNLITDSSEMSKYYKRMYNAESTVIAYGANIPEKSKSDQLKNIMVKYQLEPKKYILQVTRFEPENNPLLSLRAFKRLNTSELKIMIIGGVPSETRYSISLIDESKNCQNISLPGFIYEKDALDVLWTNCLCYVHGNQIGGTNPALLQAMAAGRPVIARDCVFNREVLSTFGYYYEKSEISLKTNIQHIIENFSEAEEKAECALQRVKQYYNWEVVVAQYENFFRLNT